VRITSFLFTLSDRSRFFSFHHYIAVDAFPDLVRSGAHTPFGSKLSKLMTNLSILRALTMSPEQFQYIWRKTIPHIEVGMGSGVFTSHRSARFVKMFN